MAFTGLAVAAPQPAKSSNAWELKFDFADLQRITLRVPGNSQPQTFWYLLYTVTNESEKDVEFFPSFELVTDSLQVVTAGDYIHPRVVDAIAARHKAAHPFFIEPSQVSGRLRVGTDNSKTSAAIFRDFDPQSNSLRVFASGLTGEVTRVTNPAFDGEKKESIDNQRFFTLRKTLMIEYDLPGDPMTRSASVPVRKGWSWVMR